MVVVARVAVVVIVSAFGIMMMRAAFWFVHQLAVKIRRGERLHRGAGFARANFDALLRKQIQGTPADAARDNDVCALLVQPARKKSRRVRRRGHRPDADDFPLLGVRFHERELSAAAKVSVEAAFG